MAEPLREGDRVAWSHSRGTSHGKVVEVATTSGKIEDFAYEASEDDPRYIVESDDTGARAAHKAEALRKE